MSSTLGGSVCRKRARGNDDNGDAQDVHFDKRSRKATERPGDNEKWYHGHHDSVLSTPTLAREQPKYDSDEASSRGPESPLDVSMSSGDEMDGATFSESPEDNAILQPRASQWRQRLQTHRVPTPIVDVRPGARPLQRSGVRQHVRQRHPQEYISSSDLLEVPSPIDEDEVPTPPSAAEAAGSQLSMLTVSDIDMDDDQLVPTISIDSSQPAGSATAQVAETLVDSAGEVEPMDSGPDVIIVRKQRQRSGALSSGNSLVRPGPSNPTTAKRGFSVGFRADCEKCRMRVPGHMNHFLG